MRIPLFRPVISEDALEAVGDVLRSGWLGLGLRTEAFEQAFATYLGIPHCVALDSGTSALHLALRLLDLEPGDEVVTTPITFVATNHAILYERASPVFADVQPDTGNIDTAAIAGRITERTKAILIVHFGGYPCDIDEIYALARSHDIPVIEDCAHASGATYQGRRIGSHGELHAFSFHPTKNLTAGQGGALTVRSDAHDSRLRRLRSLGIDRPTFRRINETAYDWDYDVTEVGFRSYMSDFYAVIGLTQLNLLDEENRRRAVIAAHYSSRLRGVAGVQLLRRSADRESNNHIFSILVDERDALSTKLATAGVDTGVHYRRNDLYDMYETQDLPNAERFWRREMSLPMHLQLTDEQVDFVCDTIEAGW